MPYLEKVDDVKLGNNILIYKHNNNSGFCDTRVGSVEMIHVSAAFKPTSKHYVHKAVSDADLALGKLRGPLWISVIENNTCRTKIFPQNTENISL